MDPVQEHSEAGVIISGSRINNLKFADDVDLIDERGLQQQVDSLHDNSMHRNQEKTKTMVSCRREEENEIHLSINNVAVENVPSFVYLGSTLTWDNDCSVEIKNRIQKATRVYSDLKVIWNGVLPFRLIPFRLIPIRLIPICWG